MKLAPSVVALVIAASAGPALAVDVLLDFSGNICGAAGNTACGNGSQIGQGYGDVAGTLDVSYRSFLVSVGSVSIENFLKYWNADYSNLTGVAWGGANGTAYRSEITFQPTTGLQVTLNSFQFGDYQNRNNGSTVQVYDITGTTLLWDGGAFDPGLTAVTFSPAVTARGLVLRWGPDGYDVGIDNISVTVSAVPEPSTFAFALAGAGLLTLRRLRRA